MSQRRLDGIALLLAAAATAAAGPVAADILVTQDGARVETKGPWQVKGATIVFNLPNGTLSMLRASEVDLDASHRATEEALRPPPPPPAPPPKKAPIAVITTEDVGRVEPPNETNPAEGGEQAAQAATPKTEVSTDLEVVGWRVEDRPGFSGVVIVGSVRNTGPVAMGELSIEAVLLDEKGKPGTPVAGFLRSRVLFSQAIATFEIPLAGVHDVHGLEIRPRGVAVNLGVGVGAAARPEAAAGEEAGGAEAGAGDGASTGEVDDGGGGGAESGDGSDAEPADTGGG